MTFFLFSLTTKLDKDIDSSYGLKQSVKFISMFFWLLQCLLWCCVYDSDLWDITTKLAYSLWTLFTTSSTYHDKTRKERQRFLGTIIKNKSLLFYSLDNRCIGRCTDAMQLWVCQWLPWSTCSPLGYHLILTQNLNCSGFLSLNRNG